MFDVYLRGKEATYHCDDSWRKKVSYFPQLGHKIFLKMNPGQYETFRVVDILWNDSSTVFIELEKESDQ